MIGQRHRGLIAGLRGELPLFARVAFLVLALPLFLHPLSEASAEASGKAGLGVICTAFSGEGVSADLPGAPDSCPCGTPCTMHGLAAPILPAEVVLAATFAEPVPDASFTLTAIAPLSFSWLRPPGRAPPVIA
jgi:hypothetical protein